LTLGSVQESDQDLNLVLVPGWAVASVQESDQDLNLVFRYIQSVQ
jgi:hypothetical protein